MMGPKILGHVVYMGWS